MTFVYRIEPQVMLVEERGLNNQIKRLKSLTFEGEFSPQYLTEQLTTIIKDLEDIKLSIKSENDRVLTYRLKKGK